ncbi:hypothetical protein SAMN02745121_07389 [Nannocystis exedens]|uniref:Uncharacterized protein n=2 Tax=Nannocystis exedens TaxID=54 RepID=A0A1I2GNN7_9BACT|nr:hypothetical protein NAEX_06728 [Nannocystis exedens]SFF18211.1 hypothetical protein SAMN02745121_07389 [Nannocystis exedens]
MRVVVSEAHGAGDLALIFALALAPAWFSADTPRVATTACYVVMLGLWLLSQLTCYPFGSLCLVRYKVHGIVESSLAPVLVALPWLLGFAEWPAARVVFVLAGVAALLLGLTTWGGHDERECPPEPPIDRGARPPHQGP